MTTKEMILKRCRAAHSIIADIEFFVKEYISDNGEVKKNPPKPSQPNEKGDSRPRKGSGDISTTPTVKECVKWDISQNPQPLEFHTPKKDQGCTIQGDLFDGNEQIKALYVNKKSKVVTKPHHKAGTPRLNRREVLGNFRKIAGGKEILDLGDVNRIFGYNPSTSGVFIQHAVKRGDLPIISYGTKKKFLSRDVKVFIKSWFDSVEL